MVMDWVKEVTHFLHGPTKSKFDGSFFEDLSECAYVGLEAYLIAVHSLEF